MNILVLSYEYPPLGGGGGIICKNISEELAKSGNSITILTTATPEERNSFPGKVTKSDRNVPHILHQTNNLTIIKLRARRKNNFQSNPLEMVSWICAAKDYIRTTPGFVNFDICMAHFVLPGGEVAWWLKKNFGLPYVLISHGHEIPWIHPRQMFFFHTTAYLWIRKVCKHSEINFVQTSMMKNNIDRFLGKKYTNKNRIVPNGVDTNQFKPDYSLREKTLQIMFTGRLVIQKDPMTFLKAIRMASLQIHDFEVHIFGEGNLRKRMERYVNQHGLSGKVNFMGKIAPEAMVRHYQRMHLMVSSSLNEGMSIAALEALSCGVYLIATPASGYRDMISENINGEITAFRNPEELAGRIIRFYKLNFRKSPEIISHTTPPKVLDWKTISREYQRRMAEIVS